MPAEKRSFARRPDLARAAGRKGGAQVPAAKRTFATDPNLAAEAGRKGGEARALESAEARASESSEAPAPESRVTAPADDAAEPKE